MFTKLFNIETIVKVAKEILGLGAIVYSMAYSYKKGSSFSIILGVLFIALS